MKIEKNVEAFVDVEVEVTLEDITACIWEDPKRIVTVLRGISNCHRFLKAIPDEVIREMKDPQRNTILTAMTEQVKRFASDSSEVQK